MEITDNPTTEPAIPSWKKCRQGKKQLTTYLDEPLATAFKEVAKIKGRSVHAQTVYLIKKFVEQSRGSKAKK